MFRHDASWRPAPPGAVHRRVFCSLVGPTSTYRRSGPNRGASPQPKSQCHRATDAAADPTRCWNPTGTPLLQSRRCPSGIRTSPSARPTQGGPRRPPCLPCRDPKGPRASRGSRILRRNQSSVPGSTAWRTKAPCFLRAKAGLEPWLRPTSCGLTGCTARPERNRHLLKVGLPPFL